MRNLWLIARHQYREVVVKRGFIILTLAIPVGLASLVALSIFVFTSGQSNLPMGYVDQAGLLDAAHHQTEGQIEVRAFPDEAAALAALQGEEIQAFFIFPADYLQTLQTDLYYLQKPPGEEAWGEFDDWVRANLLVSYPADLQARLLEGPVVTVHDPVSNRKFSESDIINIVLPFVATFFFFIANMLAVGYTLGIVADEKENRTMEIMLTSVTPGQLIGGKMVGLLAAALTQLAVYVVAAVVALKIAAPYVVELQAAQVPWGYLGVMALFFLPAYGLVAAVMVSIGSAAGELEQGQQIAGIVNLFFMLPLLLAVVVLENPSHPLVLFMTFFPTTSFLTISLRWGVGTVPLWQLALSWVLLVAAVAFMTWAAIRIFRLGMLRYGQPLSLKTAVAAIRGQ